MPACACNSILGQIIIIAAVGAAIGTADAFLRPVDLSPRAAPPPLDFTAKPPSGETPKPANPASAFTPTKKEDLKSGEITLDEAKALFDQQTPFIDARKPDPYKTGHVKGAFRMAEADFQFGNPPMLAAIPRDGKVVVYCSGGHCDESELVARLLGGSGYNSIYVMHDGFPGWSAMGFPFETGDGQ